jgi:hypothetical protein
VFYSLRALAEASFVVDSVPVLTITRRGRIPTTTAAVRLRAAVGVKAAVRKKRETRVPVRPAARTRAKGCSAWRYPSSVRVVCLHYITLCTTGVARCGPCRPVRLYYVHVLEVYMWPLTMCSALIALCTGRTSSVASTVAPTKPKSRHSSSKSSSAFRLFGNVSGSSTLITPDMITYYKELSISKDLVDRLKHASVRSPQLLLGWQLVVVLEAGTNAGTDCVCRCGTWRHFSDWSLCLRYRGGADFRLRYTRRL